MDSLQARFVGKFYGPFEIKDVAVRSEGVFNIVLDDKRTIPCTEKALITIVTDEKKDHNHIRDSRFSVVIPQITKIIEEYNIPVGDINALLQEIGREVDSHFARATNWLWTKDDSRFVPGFNPMEDITLSMAREVTDNIIDHDTRGDTTTETAGN